MDQRPKAEIPKPPGMPEQLLRSVEQVAPTPPGESGLDHHNDDLPGPPRLPGQPALDPRPEQQKEEPVRKSTGEAAIAGGLVVVCNKLGIADFTLEEALMIVLAVFALANEVARMHVFAKPKG